MSASRIADLIEGLDFFSAFSFQELQLIARHLGHVNADEGDVIFSEGDPGDCMLILVEGRLSLYKAGQDGSQLCFSEGKGRILGEMALLDREPRSATCVAESGCELLTLSHRGLDNLVAEAPGIAYRLMFSLARQLSKRLRLTSDVLAEHTMG